MYFNRVLIEYIDFTLNTFNFLEYSAGFFRSSKVYDELGQHKYEAKDPDNIKEYFGDSRFGTYIYVGQVNEETNLREGVGICVSQNGCTLHLNNINNFEYSRGRVEGWYASWIWENYRVADVQMHSMQIHIMIWVNYIRLIFMLMFILVLI